MHRKFGSFIKIVVQAEISRFTFVQSLTERLKLTGVIQLICS